MYQEVLFIKIPGAARVHEVFKINRLNPLF